MDTLWLIVICIAVAIFGAWNSAHSRSDRAAAHRRRSTDT